MKSIKIAKLTLLERNPRRISKDQMAKLEKSLTEDPDFLNCRPILVNEKDGQLQVYAGNQRVRAAKKLKWKEVPCIVDKDLDSEIMRARTIKDNKTYGEFDLDMIANEWDIEELLDAGFQNYELPELEGCIEEEEISLPDGEKEFAKITFTLSDEQKEIVLQAIKVSKKMGPFHGGNENSNGNAINRIAEFYTSHAKN